MIHHERGFRRERQALGAKPGDHLERVAGAPIVNHREINARNDHVTRAHRRAPGVRRENLFGYRVTHYSLRVDGPGGAENR